MLWAKPLSVPPETVTSAAVKLLESSLRVKVMRALCPPAMVALSAVTMMVGGVVSMLHWMAIEAMLFSSLPSWLKLPAASVKLSLAMKRAALRALALGVKVAV